MKKILMIAALATACFAHADDSYLYWMISGNHEDVGDWSYAKVKAINDSTGASTYLTLSPGYDTTITYEGNQVSRDITLDDIAGVAAQLGGSEQGFSYLIELYNDDDAQLGYSDKLAYSAAAVYIGTEMGTTEKGMWNASTWHIPEPSSGLLALLGMSLLALRRRRMKA